jgi:hypothetical protein
MGRLPLVDSGDAGTSSPVRKVLATARTGPGRSVDPDVHWAPANHPRAAIVRSAQRRTRMKD